MLHVYKDVTFRSIDLAHAGRNMAEIDGLYVYRGKDHIIVVKDDKVVDRFTNVSMYEYFLTYAKSRVNLDEEIRVKECE